MRGKLLFFIIISSILLFASNAFALRYDLYFITDWFDTISHTLGGIVTGALFVYFSLLLRGKYPNMLSVIAITLLVGILWEYFELARGLTYLDSPKYALDTLGDLIFDILGAGIAYLFVKKS